MKDFWVSHIIYFNQEFYVDSQINGETAGKVRRRCRILPLNAPWFKFRI